ncbi:MAG: hypothetical protein JNM34_08305 [Chthonomonadaceae bacterium]|nr:hypothetical protein [Chthonomonadaceae bacterium]
MLLSEAKKHVGVCVNLMYKERSGDVVEQLAEIFDIGFVPLYGPCLITDQGEFRLDKVVSCEPVSQQRAA